MLSLEKLDKRFVVSLIIVLPAWFIVWYYPESQSHQVLGTNLLMLVAGYWIGSSKGSQDKDKVIAHSPPVQSEGGE